jgi:hypothetical protein
MSGALGLLAGALVLIGTTTPAEAQSSATGVGLGVGMGLAVPTADEPFKPAAAWGFYVDIPLNSSFHITPSTLVYRLDRKDGELAEAATDVAISFKFNVPLGRLAAFGGVTAGITSTDELAPHVGALVGGSVNLISNLDLFVNVTYRYLIDDGKLNAIHDVQVFAGPLFRFTYY